jgi:hypothetical protein
METKINVRGEINSLKIGGEALELPKDRYMLSSVRASASSVTGDTGKRFTITYNQNVIIVKRIA